MTIDLKDAYFRPNSSVPYRPFLQFPFEGHIKVILFGLSLSTCVFTQVVEAALVPLGKVDIHILNFPRLNIADSEELVCAHMDMILDNIA